MSQSKFHFVFPFYNYPYTLSDKFKYYSGKIACGGCKLLTANIYAKYLLSAPFLTNTQLIEKKSTELQSLVDLTKNNRWWHLKVFFSTLCLSAAGAFTVHHYGYISHPYFPYGLAGSGLLLLNSFYGIIGNTYNAIRYKQQICINSHGINVARAIKAIHSEVESVRDDKHIKKIDESSDKKSIDELIYKDINASKKSWTLETYYYDGNKNIPTQTSSSETLQLSQPTYVIHNLYYEKLFFVFNLERIAKNFILELENLSPEQIDFLSNNPAEATLMRNEFVKELLGSIAPQTLRSLA